MKKKSKKKTLQGVDQAFPPPLACLPAHSERKRERQRDRQTEGERERPTQIERQTDTERGIKGEAERERY